MTSMMRMAAELILTDAAGQEVGHMRKMIKGWTRALCCGCCIDDTKRMPLECYAVEFSEVQCPRDRALVMALAVFTDFRYWDGTDEDYEACF